MVNWARRKYIHSGTTDYKPSPQLAITGNTWTSSHAYIVHEPNIVLQPDFLWEYLTFVTISKRQFFFYWLDFCSINDGNQLKTIKPIIALFGPKYLLLYLFFSKIIKKISLPPSNIYKSSGNMVPQTSIGNFRNIVVHEILKCIRKVVVVKA